MAEPIKVLGDELEIEAAKIHVVLVGSGYLVSVTLADADGTVCAAASRAVNLKGEGFDMDEAMNVASELVVETRAMLDASNKTGD